MHSEVVALMRFIWMDGQLENIIPPASLSGWRHKTLVQYVVPFIEVEWLLE